MPAAIKRRKVSATTSKNAFSSNTKPRGIDAFTRVSKASSTVKSIIDKNNYVDSLTITQLENNSVAERKRKLVTVDEKVGTESAADDQASEVLSSVLNTCRDIKPLPQRRSNDLQRLPKTPQKPIPNEVLTPTETPTKGARSLLDQLFLSKTTPTKSRLRFDSSNTLDSTPRHDSTSSQELPNELLDLINLHASFLTALSLHYAHNGTHSPADLRLLCPDIARAWGKRRVTLEDIRRTLGVMNSNYPEEETGLSRLSLSDYAHGKICIEIRTGLGRTGKIVRPLNENLLNEIYVRGLKNLWQGHNELETGPKDFIANLPMEPIVMCSSVLKVSPLLAKGQRRLEDMKAGITIRKEAAAKEKSSTAVTSDGARPTLLERLRARQVEKSTLPAPPSKAELSRKAALQRVGEVVSVLTLLSTSSSVGQQRISFTLPTVLSKLQDSTKTPISKEEGLAVLRLLAAEIAPRWAKIVKMGKMEALVVNRDERLTDVEIKERVKQAA